MLLSLQHLAASMHVTVVHSFFAQATDSVQLMTAEAWLHVAC